MLEQFIKFFDQYGVISIPNFKALPRDFMAKLDQENITYSVINEQVDNYHFYIFTKL
jgi:hypothetical protein